MVLAIGPHVWHRRPYTRDHMTDEERSQIIALCEDPEEDFADVQGRPPTPEEIAVVESLAQEMFLRLSPEQQVDDLLHLPSCFSEIASADARTRQGAHTLPSA